MTFEIMILRILRSRSRSRSHSEIRRLRSPTDDDRRKNSRGRSRPEAVVLTGDEVGVDNLSPTPARNRTYLNYFGVWMRLLSVVSKPFPLHRLWVAHDCQYNTIQCSRNLIKFDLIEVQRETQNFMCKLKFQL